MQSQKLQDILEKEKAGSLHFQIQKLVTVKLPKLRHCNMAVKINK